jgi:hypothetical protein
MGHKRSTRPHIILAVNSNGTARENAQSYYTILTLQYFRTSALCLCVLVLCDMLTSVKAGEFSSNNLLNSM